MSSADPEDSSSCSSNSSDCSFAVEYGGPVVPSYHIPKVMPINLDRPPIENPNPTPTKFIRWNPQVVVDRSEIYGELNEEAGSQSEQSSTQGASPTADGDRRRRKGSCHMCGRGKRWKGKKVRCVVCDARYCEMCVLKAMGSMPEGRKCVGCVGMPVDEARRRNLGRGSRALRRLLSSREVRMVMKAEKWSETNWVRPETVFVNGQPLESREKLVLLESSCGIDPPGKLKPGRYWYDNVSGFWGLEGHKPHRIIAHSLNIGGTLEEMSSKGDTQIFINGRRITRNEKYLLKFAGVPCAGNPHFWLSANGDCREEGQRTIRGNLWSHPGTKLVCYALSLPFPCTFNEVPNGANRIIYSALPNHVGRRQIPRLILIGCHGSGAATLFKQASFLYKSVPFTEEAREDIKGLIQCNTYRYLGMLLEGRERFEEECLSRQESDDQNQQTDYSIPPRLKNFSDWLLGIIDSGTLEVFFPAATREYAPSVKNLWRTAAIQATYNRRGELQDLPSVASYFLERVEEVLAPDYNVSDQDILYADFVASSNGMECSELKFSTFHDDDDNFGPHGAHDLHDQSESYELIMVHTKSPNKNNKWLEMFEDARMVIFCVGLSEYNESCEDADGNFTNKMLANKKLFENISTNPALRQKIFLLVLNNFSLLEQKIEQAPLTLCDWFCDFNPVKNRPSRSRKNASYADQAFHYIASKFKKLFASLTNGHLYVVQTESLNSNSVDGMFRYATEILKWEEEKEAFGTGEVSTYSMDSTSSFSR